MPQALLPPWGPRELTSDRYYPIGQETDVQKRKGPDGHEKISSEGAHLISVTLPEAWAQTGSRASTPALPIHGSSTLSQKQIQIKDLLGKHGEGAKGVPGAFGFSLF